MYLNGLKRENVKSFTKRQLRAVKKESTVYVDTGAKRGRDGGGEWGSPVSPEVLRCNLMNTLLENFIDDAIA